MRKLGYEGEKLIKHYESCRLEAYQDGGGVWTIGYGNTYYENGQQVKGGDKIPQWRADELFSKVAAGYAGRLTGIVEGINLKSYQFDALVSFSWNVGISAFESSTLLKVIRNNPNALKSINTQFMRWIYDNGIAIKGLINRRESESWLYCHGELKFFN